MEMGPKKSKGLQINGKWLTSCQLKFEVELHYLPKAVSDSHVDRMWNKSKLSKVEPQWKRARSLVLSVKQTADGDIWIGGNT